MNEYLLDCFRCYRNVDCCMRTEDNISSFDATFLLHVNRRQAYDIVVLFRDDASGIYWHSSSIVKRINGRLLETNSRSRYRLLGDLDEIYAKEVSGRYRYGKQVTNGSFQIRISKEWGLELSKAFLEKVTAVRMIIFLFCLLPTYGNCYGETSMITRGNLCASLIIVIHSLEQKCHQSVNIAQSIA